MYEMQSNRIGDVSCLTVTITIVNVPADKAKSSSTRILVSGFESRFSSETAVAAVNCGVYGTYGSGYPQADQSVQPFLLSRESASNCPFTTIISAYRLTDS